MKFDKNGNLQETKILAYEEFEKAFGCASVYIAGSFVTSKEFPNDIDLCADITNIDYKRLSKEYPELLSAKGIQKIKNEYKVHLIFYDAGCLEYLDWFRKDRDDNPKGLVKIYLNDIDGYD